MVSLSLSHSDKAFGYVLAIDPALEGMRRLWKAEHICNVSLPFVSTGVYGRERGTSVEENRHVSRGLEE